MEARYREAVECVLGRTLTDEEVAPAASLDALKMTLLFVVQQLYKTEPIVAMNYLRGVIEDSHARIRTFIYEFIETLIYGAPPKPALRALDLYENVLGRKLDPSETVHRSGLAELSTEQRAVARELTERDRDVAMLYLVDVVWGVSGAERARFLATL